MEKLYIFLFIVSVAFMGVSQVTAQGICEETTIYINNEVYAALPNIFTPDNDGLNDLLTIYNSNATRRLIKITDTTANNNILFESTAIDDTGFWDGLNQYGVEAPEAAYNLKADFEFETGEIRPNCRTIYLVRENCLDLSGIELDFPTDFDETTQTFLDNEITLPDCVLGVNELFSVDANIQPTIVQNKIIVNSSEPVINLNIYDLSGKTVFSKKIKNSVNFEVNVNELKTGIYYLFLNHQEKYSTHQFFKE